MRGKKGEKHSSPLDPPRRRANNQPGRGTYANDRPPVVGTVGRESGQVRLRVVPNTTAETLEAQVHRFTQTDAIVYTDELASYNHILRQHARVAHGEHEYARDGPERSRRMAMASAKCIVILPKGCGPTCEIFCDHSRVCIRNTWQAMLPSLNSTVTSSASRLRLFQRWSPFTLSAYERIVNRCGKRMITTSLTATLSFICLWTF